MTIKKTNHLSELNDAQKEAVGSVNGPLLVLAGAGTGKTRVLTSRLSYILQNNIARPSEICTVTFTNKAANEMRMRVEKMIGNSIAGWWLGTFHSLAARILRANAELVNLKNTFTIIDTDDQIRLIKQLLSLENIDEKRWPARSLLSIIQRWKDMGLNPIDVKDAFHSGTDFANNQAIKLYKLYQNRLITLNAADFGDLLLHVITIFQRNSDIKSLYQNKFKYILVDEFQDTNASQYYWLKSLAEKHKNLCAVGDDDQSIYSWRGADVSNILNFEKDFQNTKTIRLEENYRSTGNILAAASGLISKNQSRLGKTLWTEGDIGNLINIRTVYDGKEEAESISDEIEAYQRNNNSINNVAILVRAGFQTRTFEERFLKIGLPYQVVGGLRFYERLEIRDAIAYLRLINSSDDQLAFERIINKPKRGLGDKTIRHIEQYSRSSKLNLEMAARKLSETDELSSKASSTIRLFSKNLDKWRIDLAGKKLGELVEIVLEESGYIEMLKKDRSIEAPGRLDNLKELVNAINEFESLQNFLEHIQLVMEGANNQDIETAKIMTLHAAKGLEFPLVFLPGWEEGLFPNQRSIDENGESGLEEERRLAYVGITRAKSDLWIFNANSRLTHGQWIDCIPSRFLDELPEKNISRFSSYSNNYNFKSSIASEWLMANNKKVINHYEDNKYDINDSNFKLMERIFHQKFGYGKIIDIDGDKVTIDFEKAGEKKLMLTFIEKI
ncbi:MAG: UvrD-helicase domain-containing protein [Alphaproteobacteria bacterium]|nr:UvrD-helicase domain-containing protein [Alphaproteobacteria bacterium]